MKLSSRYSPVRSLSTTFPDQAAEPPYFTSATPAATLPEKTKGFAPPNCYTSQLLDNGGWHDCVVDMMVERLTMTSVRDSEVF